MRKHILFVTVCLFLVLSLNFIALRSAAFSDFYAEWITPVWLNTYGRLTGSLPFSIGEIMIAFMLMLVIVTIASGLIAVIFYFGKKEATFGIRAASLCKKGSVLVLYLSCVTTVLLTMNCFIYYQCSRLYPKSIQEEETSLEELTLIRNYIVLKTNELSLMVERGENGEVVYSDSMEEQAVTSMQALGESNQRLAGYYPFPKKIVASNFLSQQSMKGYYFPFSMEANYNATMGAIHIPATMCHELAHVKGFLFEEEANMLAFLACINSEDLVFQYSGYLSVLNYIDNDYYRAINKNKEIYAEQVAIEDRVRRDNVFVTEQKWNKIEEKSLMKTETIKKATQIFTETTLKVNGVENGMKSYSDVVKLLLQHYQNLNLERVTQEEYLVNAGSQNQTE